MLTPQDRKTLVRLASTLGKGSKERRAILGALSKEARSLEALLKNVLRSVLGPGSYPVSVGEGGITVKTEATPEQVEEVRQALVQRLGVALAYDLLRDLHTSRSFALAADPTSHEWQGWLSGGGR